jgi:hypothetical protein
MSTVLASAADERYGFHLLNMLGSIQANADQFDAIVVHDLGLSEQQRRLVRAIDGVELRAVPPFVPHWAQGFTWKPWIWTHVEADRIFYLDAGATVLRRLDEVFHQIDDQGYFVVSQNAPTRTIVPADWLEEAGIDSSAAEREYIAAGIIGFETHGRFWEEVIVPTFEDCVAGRSLGFSPAEAEALNFGLGRTENVVLRDVELFRHDQSVLNVHFLAAFPDARINDVYEFGGWMSPHDHPRQVIWSNRRRGDYRYLARARYRGAAARLEARVLAARLRSRLWLRQSRRYAQPHIYTRRLRGLAGGRRP